MKKLHAEILDKLHAGYFLCPPKLGITACYDLRPANLPFWKPGGRHIQARVIDEMKRLGLIEFGTLEPSAPPPERNDG